MKTEELVAVCGLYCGACTMYRTLRENNEQKTAGLIQILKARGMDYTAEELKCDGCLANGRLTPFCRVCEIRLCPQNKDGVIRCADCPEFPCARITAFNNDGNPHHAEVLENCRRLKEDGIEKWAKSEEERWLCPQCKTQLSWYDMVCPKCGAPRSDKLFKMG